MTMPHENFPKARRRLRTTRALVLGTAAIAAVVLAVPATRNAIIDLFKSSTPMPEPPCQVEMLPFVVGLTLKPPGESLYTYSPPPPSASLTVPQHGPPSELLLDTASLNPNPENKFIVDAFSVGADWIRVLDAGDGTWEFNDLTGTPIGDDPGWAILFYVIDRDVFALGWGGVNNTLLVSEWGENPKLNANWNLDSLQREPLHTLKDFPRATRIDAVDFSAAAVLDLPPPPPSCGWKPEDGSQNEQIESDAVYYSLAGSAVIFRAEPVAKSGSFSWTTSVFLTPEQLGLTNDHDVDALSYDMQAGLLIYSLSESSPPPNDLPERPLYLIRGAFPNNVSNVELPAVLNAPGGQSLTDVIGPRVRGTCKIDPTIVTGGFRPG